MLISNYAIKFRTAVFVFVVVLVLAGMHSYLNLPREGSPDITIPYVFISAVYDGTAPAEMEKLVTIPLERQLNDVENVKEMTSVSGDSFSSITVEFRAGQDIDVALQKTKNKVDLARADLPDDLDEPVVQALNFSSDFPIFRVALSGATTLSRLKSLAESLQDEIEQLAGVKAVEIAGTREREIRVAMDRTRLAAFGIPVGLVMQRIAAENATFSAGNIEVKGNKFQVRIPGEFKLAAELRAVLLMMRNGVPVYLRDVATVEDTFKDLTSISRLNGQPSVSVSVKKRSGENSVRLIDDVKRVMDKFLLPADVKLTIVMDESDYVAMMIDELESNVASGFILVVIVLLIFMGWRNSLFVALAIPFSMLIAFTIMSLMGFTLNMIVLFSLVLAVGMLVDNAIVIVENIYRHRSEGATRIEAARRGASEVAWPVITSTLTTCAAFSPLLFWPDVMGQFMGFMPRTLIVILFASLFVAMVINPAICSALISAGKRSGGATSATPPARHWFVNGYERLLRGALRVRVPVLLIGFAALVLTIQLYGRYGQGVELFPDTEPRNASIEVKYPQGTSIERTDAALRTIEAKLKAYADIEFFLTTVGSAGGGGFLGGGQGTHLANVFIEFVDIAERHGSSMDLVKTMRDAIGQIPGAEVRVDKQEEGPPVGAPVSIELSGDDLDMLSGLAAQVIHSIESIPGLVDLLDDYEEALPELQFRVDRQRAALLGLDSSAIGNFLRTAIYGLPVSKLRVDEEEYDITLRLPLKQRSSVRMLDEVSIPLPDGGAAPLAALGAYAYTGGQGTIQRRNQKRIITVSGNAAGRGVDKILEDVRQRLDELALPSGYALRFRGDDEEMKEAGAFLGRAFAIALGLILVILVVQFNSAILPAIILFSVVLSLMGVMAGLLICRMRFGVIMTGVGVISLAGIVVNNAIVLIDCIRQRQAAGMAAVDAIAEAGRLRLRPVLLTAVTTILGLIPMAVGYSLDVHQWPPHIVAGAESSAWWAPMAVAVIFGLSVSTVLTLLLVPVMYSLADSAAGAIRKRFPVEG
jgi:multidrug efflux pump